MGNASTHSRILIVDDSAFARRRLAIIFESAGHEIVGSAVNGEQAVTMYTALHPDVVTLDYLMKGKSGVDVLKDIIGQDPAAKVIIISGSGDHNIAKEAMAAGAKGFIDKTNGKATFLRAVDQAMSM